MLSEERLKEIEGRVSRATPGPWAWEYDDGNPTDQFLNARHPGRVSAAELVEANGERWIMTPGSVEIDLVPEENDGRSRGRVDTIFLERADAELIAHARTDLPDLLAALDELQSEVARLRERVSFGNHKRHQCEDNLSAAEARLALTRGELDAAYEMASRLIAEKKALEAAGNALAERHLNSGVTFGGVEYVRCDACQQLGFGQERHTEACMVGAWRALRGTGEDDRADESR